MVTETNSPQHADVSVVIPVYNAESTLPRALASIAGQTWLPHEVIIVDDASTDGSVAVVQELAETFPQLNLQLVRHDANQGAAASRNTGWEAACGRYIAFLDADDAWYHEKIRIQYQWMIEHTDYGITGHACPEIKSLEGLAPKQENIVATDIGLLRMLLSNRFLTPTVMLRRDLSQRFCEKARYAEDYLLWLQIVSKGVKAAYINQPLAGIFKPVYGKQGLSANLWAMQKGVLNAYLQLYQTGRINLVSLILLSTYSMLKYFRRIAIVTFRSLFSDRQ